MTIRVPQGSQVLAQSVLAKIPQSQRLNFLAHAVRKGDTLSGIARKLGSSTDMLRQFNHLNAKSHLRVGQKLIVPSFSLARSAPQIKPLGAPIKRRSSLPPRLAAGKMRPVAPKRAPLVASSALRNKKPKARHVVSYGDTLWSIARRYGVSVGAIKQHRGHSSNRLAVGEVLEIF